MRAGWQIKSLGELAVKITDGSHNPPKGVEMSEYLMLSSQNVWNGFLDKSIARHLSKQDFLLEDKRTCAREGDVLLTIVGTIGRTCVLSSKDTNITFQRSVCVIKPKPELNPFFLSYQLQFKNKEINEQANGAAQKGFYLKQVERLPIFITSIPEQHRIVDILDREFAKIDALKANAEKSLQAAKDLFQATTDTMMSNGQWRELTIGEIAKIKGGKRVPKGYKLEKEPTAHRYIRVADFTDLGTIRTESVLYISDEVYKSIKAYTISSKDVYISIAGTIGKSGIIPDTLDGANLTENACKLVLGPNFYNRFVFFATKTSSFKKQVGTLTMQAAQPKLALTRLATIRVRVPSSIKEQETIVERLDGIADTIALLQENYQKTLALCDDLKQALLRKAFNGEL